MKGTKTTLFIDYVLIGLLFLILFLFYKANIKYYEAQEEAERYKELAKCYELALETKIEGGTYDHRSFRYLQSKGGQ